MRNLNIYKKFLKQTCKFVKSEISKKNLDFPSHKKKIRLKLVKSWTRNNNVILLYVDGEDSSFGHKLVNW